MEKAKTILLVEDNPINQDMLSRRLLRRGYNVVLADDGAEGCSLALSQQPDLILMDMSLPIMDGWEATRKLKADKKTSSIPIIALTAHAMVGDFDKAMEAGCDDYHTKPIELSKLLDMIENLLAKQSIKPFEIEQTSMPIVNNNNNHNNNNKISLEVTSSEITDFKTLLVVDDDEMNRDMLSRRLDRIGYKVLVAINGEETLEILKQQAVDLVLLDIMMPGISGLETLKIIRQTYSQAQLPVLMATAKDESEDIITAFEIGANDYITKPINFPVALARIKSHLNTLQASAQESTQKTLSTQEQIEELPKNSVESVESVNLDVQDEELTLPVSQEESELFTLSKPIKLFYANIDSRLWRTGVLVKFSETRAEIQTNKKVKLSPQKEIKIRFWDQTKLKIFEDISAQFLGMSEEDDQSFFVEFTSQFDVIETILSNASLIEKS